MNKRINPAHTCENKDGYFLLQVVVFDDKISFSSGIPPSSLYDVKIGAGVDDDEDVDEVEYDGEICGGYCGSGAESGLGGCEIGSDCGFCC